MKEMTVAADVANLSGVIAFVEAELAAGNCLPRIVMQVTLAVEEIYVNIARYAYFPDVGDATIRCTVDGPPLRVIVQFLDRGKPYNPLAGKDPDVDAPLEDREVGGLGVFLAKKSMDDIEYEYRDGMNILTLRKSLEPVAGRPERLEQA